jgi:hypothetical protein
MKRAISFLLLAVLMAGVAQATNTVITAVTTLDGQNDYSAAPSGWTTLATGGNVNYVAYDGKYDYLIGVNVSVVRTSPVLNILAGDNPPAFRAGIGNLSVPLTNNTVKWIGPLESARFLNSSGYFHMSGFNVTTGKIAILKVKR